MVVFVGWLEVSLKTVEVTDEIAPLSVVDVAPFKWLTFVNRRNMIHQWLIFRIAMAKNKPLYFQMNLRTNM